MKREWLYETDWLTLLAVCFAIVIVLWALLFLLTE